MRRLFIGIGFLCGAGTLLGGCLHEEQAPTTATAPASATRPLTPPPGTEATPTVPPTPGPTGSVPGDQATVVPITTPFPTPAAVPDSWGTYKQAAVGSLSAYSFRYPPGWHVSGAPNPDEGGYAITLTPWDPLPPNLPARFPAGSFKVDFSLLPSGTNACGPVGTFPITVAGITGTQVAFKYDDNPLGTTGGHVVRFIKDKTQFCIVATFAGNPTPDEFTFLQIFNSISFP